MTLSDFLFRVEDHLIHLSVNILPDHIYLKWRFKHYLGYSLNLKNPRSFNEKIQWLKLNNIHPEYTDYVDKITAKELVANIIGEKYIIPTLGVWNKIENVDWGSLPNRFVIKSTNDSGGVVVCRDKSQLDIEAAKKKLKGLGGRDYTKYNKEYPYHNVKHRFIAEEYLEDESGYELKDYKFFCSKGIPKFLFVATGRQAHDTRFDFFDIDFNLLPVTNGHPHADTTPIKPENYEEMLEIAKKLSESFLHVRVDLYNVHGKIYFGELTFFHNSGMVPFKPIEWDYKLGELISLD